MHVAASELSHSVGVRREIGWTAPPSGWTKLNVDGSVLVSLRAAAAGGLLGDGSGELLVGFYCKLGICSVLEAEIWAVYHRLRVVWQRGYMTKSITLGTVQDS